METVIDVKVVGPLTLDVTFADGTRRRVNVESVLRGPIFEPLRDPAYFAQVSVDRELGTVVWPNGADLAPEFLYFGEAGPPPGYYEPDVTAEDPSRAPADSQ